MKAEQEKKSSTLIVRVNEEERAIIDQKVKEAGYKSASAYVRDYIAREQPKAKAEINPKSLEIITGLMALSSLLNSNAPREQLNSKIGELSKLAMGA